jgi:hypothetical protein
LFLYWFSDEDFFGPNFGPNRTYGKTAPILRVVTSLAMRRAIFSPPCRGLTGRPIPDCWFDWSVLRKYTLLRMAPSKDEQITALALELIEDA